MKRTLTPGTEEKNDDKTNSNSKLDHRTKRITVVYVKPRFICEDFSIPDEIWEIIFVYATDLVRVALCETCSRFVKMRDEIRNREFGMTYNKNRIWNRTIFLETIKEGTLSYLKWIVSHKLVAEIFGCEYTGPLCQVAAARGELPILKKLRKWGCHWNENVCAGAAENGALTVLIWARSKGCLWDCRVYKNAIKNDHFNILKWVQERGFFLGGGVVRSCVRHGKLDMLKWVIEKGCPWTPRDLVRLLEKYPNDEMEKWLCEINGGSLLSF